MRLRPRAETEAQPPRVQLRIEFSGRMFIGEVVVEEDPAKTTPSHAEGQVALVNSKETVDLDLFAAADSSGRTRMVLKRGQRPHTVVVKNSETQSSTLFPGVMGSDASEALRQVNSLLEVNSAPLEEIGATREG